MNNQNEGEPDANIDHLMSSMPKWLEEEAKASENLPSSDSQTISVSWQDFVAGTVAGFSINLVGFPFDTVKVRLQTQAITNNSSLVFKSGLDCTLKTLRREGFFALYRGMGGPMVTVPAVNAIVFASYESGKRFLQRSAPDQPLTLHQMAMAGAWAGFVNSLVVSPVELVKSKLQVQYTPKAAYVQPTSPLATASATTTTSSALRYNGPLDCILKIVRSHGVFGLGQGMVATIAREVPGYAGQFYAYEYLKKAFTPPGKSVNELGPGALMTAGGLAGIAAWICSYPQDIVKSRLQVQGDTRLYARHRWLPDGGFIDCWRKIVRKEGYRGLWTGFGACVVRAFPANAAGFVTYEVVLRCLRGE
eukprot:TRINITY_DN3352_c0_g1_i3.p1 TRINITY_DN3352_c0_g1~~TRINITY_DN3352_c0_g1_i3.p1  ORF type:complete len:387 (+),score=61.16 TRINITY_DN3352_c0_g1_i3:77-1162(+)